jgi:HEAT repeats/Putative zinc-finger
MNPFEKNVSCRDVAPLLVFYVCDEVSEKERKQIEAHLANCESCSLQLAEERHLQEALVAGPQTADELDASGVLLAQCRSELAESLDDMAAPPLREHWHPFGWARRWMALRPVLSGGALVLVGLIAGARMVPLLSTGSGDNYRGQTVSVVAKKPLTADQLDKLVVGGINFVPASNGNSPTLTLNASAEQPFVLSGNVDDSEMRQVLTYVVENGERFDAGVRLDCLDALKARARDEEVRRALLTAARKDRNPAVRMRALESLRDAAADDAVRQTLLDALEHDSNSGVRVEAVNLLVRSLEPTSPGIQVTPQVTQVEEDPSVERVIRALEQLQRRDPNRYVRLRSAAALRQIGPREVQ